MKSVDRERSPTRGPSTPDFVTGRKPVAKSGVPPREATLEAPRVVRTTARLGPLRVRTRPATACSGTRDTLASEQMACGSRPLKPAHPPTDVSRRHPHVALHALHRPGQSPSRQRDRPLAIEAVRTSSQEHSLVFSTPTTKAIARPCVYRTRTLRTGRASGSTRLRSQCLNWQYCGRVAGPASIRSVPLARPE
jgi:hypothetical protein